MRRSMRKSPYRQVLMMALKSGMRIRVMRHECSMARMVTFLSQSSSSHMRYSSERPMTYCQRLTCQYPKQCLDVSSQLTRLMASETWPYLRAQHTMIHSHCHHWEHTSSALTQEVITSWSSILSYHQNSQTISEN